TDGSKPGAAGGSGAEPHSQGIRRNRQVGVGQVEGLGHAYRMVGPVAGRAAAQCSRDLLGGHHLRGDRSGELPGIPPALRAVPPGPAGPGEPLVLAVRDDDLPAGELHPIKGPAAHHPAGPDDRHRPRRPSARGSLRRAEASPWVPPRVGGGGGEPSASAFRGGGRAAMTTIWPGWKPLVSESRSPNPVGTPVITPPREPIASISSSAPGMISDNARKSSLTRRSVTP